MTSVSKTVPRRALQKQLFKTISKKKELVSASVQLVAYKSVKLITNVIMSQQHSIKQQFEIDAISESSKD